MREERGCRELTGAWAGEVSRGTRDGSTAQGVVSGGVARSRFVHQTVPQRGTSESLRGRAFQEKGAGRMQWVRGEDFPQRLPEKEMILGFEVDYLMM